MAAFDEFEQLEELILGGRIPKDFLKNLRGLLHMSPRLAFVFAGLHTLEEMTEDYFHPFFASVIPVNVSFLEYEASSRMLANPSDDFLLDYNSEALQRIYALTAGQPYLLQLIGFQLVRRFNLLKFELAENRDSLLGR